MKSKMVIRSGGGLNVRRAVRDAVKNGYLVAHIPGLVVDGDDVLGFIPAGATITLIRG
jgi:hypothetical protein